MNVLNPLAWIGLLAIPAIIAMYLLKQKYTDTTVPSLFLWKEALSVSQAERPWQKLRRNLLLFIQLLLALLLVFSLANPYLLAKAPVQNLVLVLDASMSMQAADVSPSRFDSAREEMIAMISAARPDAKTTVIISCSDPYIAVNGSGDKAAVIAKIRTIKPSYTAMDIDATAALVELAAGEGDRAVYVFTDEQVDFGAPKRDVLFGGSIANTAVTLVKGTTDVGRVIALVKVRNFGPDTVKNSVALYCDGMFHDVKDVTLAPFEERDLFFTDAPEQASRLEARLSQGDMLTADDVCQDVVNRDDPQRVMLVTERNVFLENILTLLPGVELFKAAPADMEDLSGYYLYIFDGVLPETLPADGHILVFNPPQNNNLLETGPDTPVTGMYASDSQLLRLIGDITFDVSQARQITPPEWADVVMGSDETPLILSGKLGGQKIVVMGFDLHNTDLPLRKEFPIFIYNLIEYFIPGGVITGESAKAGESVTLNADPDAAKVSVVNPLDVMEILAPPFPAAPFSGTDEPGFYTVVQELSGETRYGSFAVNADTQDSDLTRPDAETAEDSEYSGALTQVNKDLTPFFLAAALMLLLVEWWVYCHGR